ncbi:hypothetical protein [Pseudoxanthomonas mexicana]|uniref:hypothetical protein n=1 Tax=Pseudoxanthomonas mexicana TaxID=128785 RepID=UPI0028ABF721|nr:hypothetical protein [Pseudoxanthomonas mexicana]
MTAPTDARAHVSRTPRPGCVACGGFGTIHVQVPGEFRIERKQCQCWRITEAMDAVAADVENRVTVVDEDAVNARLQWERA